METFQRKVDKLCGLTFLQFEAVFWEPGGIDDYEPLTVKLDRSKSFPFLDMQMTWRDGYLDFGLYTKPPITRSSST